MGHARLSIERFMETEYRAHVDPSEEIKTPFGSFVHHPEYPTRYDGNQLIRCSLGDRSVADLLNDLENRYREIGLKHRKITCHCPETIKIISKEIPKFGWQGRKSYILAFDGNRVEPTGSDIEVRQFDANKRYEDVDAVNKTEDGELTDGYLFQLSKDKRLGGSYIIGYIDDKPAAQAGWYVIDGIARSRFVFTLPEYRGRGLASTIIRTMQSHVEVREAEVFTIFCSDDGPVSLYESLGMNKVYEYYEYFKDCPEI